MLAEEVCTKRPKGPAQLTPAQPNKRPLKTTTVTRLQTFKDLLPLCNPQVQAASPDLDMKNPFSFCFSPSVLMRVTEEDSHYVLDWGLGSSASKLQGRLHSCSRVLSISPSRAPVRLKRCSVCAGEQ